MAERNNRQGSGARGGNAAHGHQGNCRFEAPRYRRIYQTEWRVISKDKAPRFEKYQITFAPGEHVHEQMQHKIAFVREQLENNVLGFNDVSYELAKVYFMNKE